MSVTDRVVIDAINLNLANRGRSLDGRPILRIVFSDEQVEKRIGTYTDWYGSILVREEYKALRETKKYGYLQGKWILERLTFLDRTNKIVEEELVEAGNGTYEPLYVFQDSQFNALPVTWPVVQRILWTLENWTPTKGDDRSAANEDREELEREARYFEEIIGQDQRSELFADEAAEFQDSTKQKYWERDNASTGNAPGRIEPVGVAGKDA